MKRVICAVSIAGAACLVHYAARDSGTGASIGTAGAQQLKIGERHDIADKYVSRTRTEEYIQDANPEGVRWIRLRLRATAVPQTDEWMIIVRDGEYRPVEQISSQRFAATPQLWTSRIPGGTGRITISYASGQGSTEPTVQLDQYLIMLKNASGPTYYSLQTEGQPAYKDLFEVGSRGDRVLGDSVALLTASFADASWCCSAVAVGDGLVLTNWHCGGTTPMAQSQYWNDYVCRDTLIDMSWDGDDIGQEYSCSQVIAKDRDRDFALLRVTPSGHTGHLRPLTVATQAVPMGTSLKLIHHPACLKKQETMGCTVVNVGYHSWTSSDLKTDLTHRCDTASGSSGGAVVDAQGRLVGLHHLGFEDSSDANLRMKTLNAAVESRAIIDFLHEHDPDVYLQIKKTP